MRLSDYKPKWIIHTDIDQNKIYTGFTFLCPHCNTQRLGISFQPAIMAKDETARAWIPTIAITEHFLKIWNRDSNSTTFENMTITPSVDCSNSGHWHGNIINGELITDQNSP